MNRAVVTLLSVLMLTTPSWAVELPPHPELVADMVMLHKGKPTEQGRFSLGKNAARIDMTGKTNQSHIMQVERDVVLVLMHEPKMIMEMKMQYNALVHQKPPGWTEECLGEEPLDGHPCKKCRVSGEFGGKKVTSTIWKAKDLGEIVIRSLDDEGSGMELRKVVQTTVDPAIFIPPSGYQKMAIPIGLGDIMKGLSK